MTKKLEEEFNLPPIEEALTQENEETPTVEESKNEIVEIKEQMSISEKINSAFKEIRGLESHESEMDDIGRKAIDSYEQLMNLGMNVSDRDAGSIFDSAAKMLKTALDAKDSKINSKLKQIDMMIKKARLDNNAGEYSNNESGKNKMLDRNELLKIINNKED